MEGVLLVKLTRCSLKSGKMHGNGAPFAQNGMTHDLFSPLLFIQLENSFVPYDRKCRICKSKVSQDAHYCHQCAYHKGAALSNVQHFIVDLRTVMPRSPLNLLPPRNLCNVREAYSKHQNV